MNNNYERVLMINRTILCAILKSLGDQNYFFFINQIVKVCVVHLGPSLGLDNCWTLYNNNNKNSIK